jgi:hypothetical protein
MLWEHEEVVNRLLSGSLVFDKDEPHESRMALTRHNSQSDDSM